MARNELHLNFYQLYVLTKDPFFPKDAVSGPDKQRLLEKEYRCLNRHQQTQIYSAALTLTKYVWIGALVGLGVGGTLAAKFRQSRSRITKAYKQLEHLPLVHFPHAKGGMYNLHHFPSECALIWRYCMCDIPLRIARRMRHLATGSMLLLSFSTDIPCRNHEQPWADRQQIQNGNCGDISIPRSWWRVSGGRPRPSTRQIRREPEPEPEHGMPDARSLGLSRIQRRGLKEGGRRFGRNHGEI